MRDQRASKVSKPPKLTEMGEQGSTEEDLGRCTTMMAKGDGDGFLKDVNGPTRSL